MAEQRIDDPVVHYTAIEDDAQWSYPGSTEVFSNGAEFSAYFNLMRLGIHHERLPPGRRTSWPHAEADEEEFVYVIEGEPDLWLDGKIKRLMPGDGVGFPAGTGIAHVFINKTESDVRLLVVGEASRQRSRIDYPLHPGRNAEIGTRHWADRPKCELGSHDGLPDKAR
ncbi:MAG: cupin domain-containing protein [Alphaproteobacteria bacterium]|nr:cupin domain-containing protein [Alphaproteobacteria bacterium]